MNSFSTCTINLHFNMLSTLCSTVSEVEQQRSLDKTQRKGEMADSLTNVLLSSILHLIQRDLVGTRHGGQPERCHCNRHARQG
jgi:hypothetical protein